MSKIEKTSLPATAARPSFSALLPDMRSGFIIFLLALPLSLGIAKASDFPPMMGLLTAIIGGLIVSPLMGAPLTIKGPAAGLIVIVAGAVADFGGGEAGWRLALGAMVVAGLLQITMGVLKMGKLADIFPLSAIHGMLAAIGLTIIARQIPVLLDINPTDYKGLGTFTLFGKIPWFIAHLDWKASLIGIVSLIIMLGWSKISHPVLKKIPSPLVVLLLAIPAELAMDFKHTEPSYALVHIGSLIDNLHIQVDFSSVFQTGIFLKYVLMFTIVGSLESLLTVKATDLIDPQRRKSDSNKDLIAIGIGNSLAAVLGGLPMISEVARSSANVSNGAQTKWANFFHGFFMLVFVVLAASFIELIPNAALAAMLISVGIKLAHPHNLMHCLHIGWEQLAVFVTTIVVTLLEDLLVGIAAGMLLEMVIWAFHGLPLSSFFKAPTQVSFEGDQYVVDIDKAAMFSNYLGIKSKLDAIPPGFDVTIKLEQTRLVDHSVMDNLHNFKRAYEAEGGKVLITGLDNHKPISRHNLAAQRNFVAAKA